MRQVFDWVVREALEELQDADMQTRLWLAATGPEVGSMTEATESLFTDSGLGLALESSEPVYGSEVDAMLRELRAFLKKLNGERRPPSEVLADARIIRVRELAAAILAAITSDAPDGIRR